MKLRNGLPLLLALAISGCASLNKEECLTADWRTVGFHDGAAGYTAERIDAHRQACAEHGVAPNLDRYLDGRQNGLKEYCRPARGYQEGLEGVAYGGVCPPELEQAFVGAHEAGLRIHAMEDDIHDQERALRAKERRLKEVSGKSAAAQSTIIASNNPTTRARALADIQSLNKEKGELEHEIDSLKHRIERLNRDVRQERFGTDARYR